MGRFIRLALWAAACGYCSSVLAADLAKIDRAIARLPQFKTDSQDYCLLVFGPEATRVWLVRDGDLLYVDRNGNGDLTEPGERVQADQYMSHPDEDQFTFKVGNLSVGGLEHKQLEVRRSRINYLQDRSAKVADLLKRQPAARGYTVSLQVETPGQIGSAIGGRVFHSAGLSDEQGVLEFAARPEEAPIIHCSGPLAVLCEDNKKWRIGETNRVDLSVGTAGFGPGTTVYAEFKIVPAELKPTLKVTFPPAAAGDAPVEKSYELGERCCGYSLYGGVRVPDHVGAGVAHVEASLSGWPGTTVASSSTDVNIVPSPSAATAEIKPVSSRLQGRLKHQNTKAEIFMIRFSPDGKEVIASDWPANTIQIWNRETGQPRLTIEAGGAPSVRDLFAVTPDWKTVYAPRHKKPKVEAVERDGKFLHRVECDDEVRAWDLATGQPLPSLRDMPAREIQSFRMSPDGRSIVTFDYLPGEVEGRVKEGTTWWDLGTRQPRHLAADVGEGAIFSPDSKGLAFSEQVSEHNFHCKGIYFYDLDSWTEKFKLPIEGETTAARAGTFGADGGLMVAAMMACDSRDDYRRGRSELTGWNTRTGEKVFGVSALDRGEEFVRYAWSPDQRILAATGFQLEEGTRSRMYLIDLAANLSKIVDIGDEVWAIDPVFDPSGKWLAVGVRDNRRSSNTLNLPPEDLRQPRIEIVDAASGRILETIYSPQAYLTSLAMGPDGKTLATSGHGEVLLWDMTRPPGESRVCAGRMRC